MVTAAAAAATQHPPHACVALDSPSPARRVCVGVDAVALWPRRADRSRTGGPARSVRAVTAVPGRRTRALVVGEGAAASTSVGAVRGRRETAAATCGAAPKPPRRPRDRGPCHVPPGGARSAPFAAPIGSEVAPGGLGPARRWSVAMSEAAAVPEALLAGCGERLHVRIRGGRFGVKIEIFARFVRRSVGVTVRLAHAGMLVGGSGVRGEQWSSIRAT